MKRSLTLLMLVHLGVTFAVLAQSPNTSWVPYSATYVQTATSASRSIKTTGEELRYNDGSSLTTKLVSGQRMFAKLRQACGQLIYLDYSKKQATIAPSSPPQHSYPSPDRPVGTLTIAGISAVGYPIHMPEGKGTGIVWMDVNNDIMLKLETHAIDSKGQHVDMVRQLTSIDFASPIDPSLLKVPPDFTVTPPLVPTPASCVSKTGG